jgi:small subunit ribosomal protein S13
MARIAGINIPMNKHVWVGLTSIYGVGRTQARKACEAAGVKPETKVKDLTEAEVAGLRSQIARLPVEGTNARTRKGPRKAAVKLNAPAGKA